MNYHNITKCDMLNGQGLRVVLWVSGCDLKCTGCHNPQTHNPTSGILFDKQAEQELFEALEKNYITGLTISGGHPLMECNRATVKDLCLKVKNKYPTKDIWLYTGYTWEFILDNKDILDIVKLCDVICDGMFIKSLQDDKKEWVGSSNQRVIDVQKSLKSGKIILL